MATFQSVVLITAIIILIVLLIVVGIAMYYKTYTEPWPPKTPLCPDYWAAVPGTVESVSKITNFDDIQFNYDDITNGKFDASGAVCVNVKKLGKCPATNGNYLVKDFTGPSFEGPKGDCSKYKWAKECGISWDGITYGTKFTPCEDEYNKYNHPNAYSGGKCYLSSLTFSSLGNSLVSGSNNP